MSFEGMTKREMAELLRDRLTRTRAGITKLREIHAREEFGDCVEDGEPFPCKTVRVLDFMDREGQSDG